MIPAAIHLDIYTLRVITCANLTLFAVITLITSLVSRRIPGIRQCSIGMFVICAGSLSGLFRSVLPAKSLILLSNILILVGGALLLNGVRQFRGRSTLPRARLIVGLAVFLVPFCYFLYANDNLPVRVVLVSPLYCIISAFAADAMLTNVRPSDRLVYWPSAFAFSIYAFVMLIRTTFALGGHYGTNIWAPLKVEIASSAAMNLAVIACALTILTASHLSLRREAETLALYDPLTKLPNRRLFLDRLLQAEQRALEAGHQLAVLYLDLDGFKAVNDTLGHQAGDQVLRTVAARLSQALTAGEVLARIGGDEFIVLVERAASREQVVALRDRLKAAVETETGVSCGFAIFPEDGSSAEAVVREADASMYEAKRSRSLSTAVLGPTSSDICRPVSQNGS